MGGWRDRYRAEGNGEPEKGIAKSGQKFAFHYALPVDSGGGDCMDGRIYFLSEEGAATAIARGKVFRRLGTSSLDGATLASMAVSDGSIFNRTDTHVYRIGRTP